MPKINKLKTKLSTQKLVILLCISAIFSLCFFTYFFTPSTIAEMIYGMAICEINNTLPISKPMPSTPYVVAIDLGHGGMDTGAQSLIDETDVIDATGDALYNFLYRDPNFSPVLTRQVGEDPDSSKRAEIVNNSSASLLISIHANANKSSSNVRGFECYPLPPGKTYHTQSMEFAQCITGAMLEAGHKLRGDTSSGIKFAYYSGKTKRIVDGSDTKVRSQNTFGILEKSNCPGVLVEQCFITSPYDVENWAKGEGITKAATAYYTAICHYFGTQPILD